jgi:hypothetical protein
VGYNNFINILQVVTQEATRSRCGFLFQKMEKKKSSKILTFSWFFSFYQKKSNKLQNFIKQNIDIFM